MTSKEKKYCNEYIHNELREIDKDILCPFCNLQLEEEYKPIKIEFCCDQQHFINDNGIVLCINCGIKSINDEYVMPYINFYENKFKFRTKTIYNPKYCILKTLKSYKIKLLTYKTQDKILRIFKEIYNVERKDNRKRMISIHYIIRCIFKMMKMDYKFIPLPKSKKTIEYYKTWWITAIILIEDKINNIIQK